LIVQRALDRPELDELLEAILACGPEAVRLQKTLIRESEDLPLSHAIERGITRFAEAFDTDKPARMLGAFRRAQAAMTTLAARRRPHGAAARIGAALRRHRRALGAALLAATVIGAASAFGAWYMARDARLGVLNFPISCGWESQLDFTTATSLLHLFQFADAEAAYRALLKRDPDCAIADWGVAMSRLRNPLYALPDADDMAAASAALAAGAAARTASPRERAWHAAAGTIFADKRSTTSIRVGRVLCSPEWPRQAQPFQCPRWPRALAARMAASCTALFAAFKLLSA
jgi:hypothetical protein